jgi:anti-anti-sigma regulatory factor
LLRITRIESQDAMTLKLEGKLAGPWVEELERTWRSAKDAARNQPLIADLNDVTFVDRAGERLLSQMHTVGTTLVAEGPYMRQRLLRITSKKRRSHS